MTQWKNPFRLALLCCLFFPFLLQKNIHFTRPSAFTEAEAEESEENASYKKERLLHEFHMLRNPVTGKIPANIHEIELKTAKIIPSRNERDIRMARNQSATQSANTYISIGPNNISGRSRTLAFDRRNSLVMLSGGVTGGIFRSTNGGVTWTFVSPEDDIRSVTTISQDPSSPDTWYCGTGEVYNATSVQEVSVPGTVGHGVFKSTNNGVTWTKLLSTADADPQLFNGTFDLVHRIAVHPTGGVVYAAVHNRIMRSADGGLNWATVLGGTLGNTATAGITDVIINATGTRIYAAFSGENIDPSLVGVWESSTGLTNSWTRIAGAPSGQGFVSGWRPYGQWGRVVLTLSPAGKLYALYKNGNSASGSNPLPEADLFRADITSGNPAAYVWENLNAWVPNEPIGRVDGVNPYTTQFSGFNMSIVVKPDQENILFIGGTVLHRVDLNETDPARKFRRCGGYGVGFFSDAFFYPNHHPDVHGIYFASGSNVEMYTVTDGGIHKTLNNMADTVQWIPLNNGFQTLQFQQVTIIPDISYDWVIGGAQDNGTVYNTDVPRSLAHVQHGQGDGAAAAMSAFYKSGNTWRQYWYYTIVQGYIVRSDLTWQLNNNVLVNTQLTSGTNITPNGLGGSGQWLTLFTLDPDSAENLYYNVNDRIFRTNRASTVNSGNWTELIGIRNTIPDSAVIASIALSRKTTAQATRFLFFGTDAGKVYRVANPSVSNAAAAPSDITPSGMLPGSYVAGIAVNPRNADTVMAVVSNYDMSGNTVRNIFWTGNATAASPTWQIIDGALEPLSAQSCAIVVRATGIEYFVGTSVGLYSTASINGNATSWANEGTGMMKHAIIRSLYNRAEDNKLVVGTHGNGAFLGAMNLTTGLPDPPVANSDFIRIVYPTISSGQIHFRTGQLTGIFQMNVNVYAVSGQRVYQSSLPYSDGLLPLTHLPAGQYVIEFSALNNKYRFLSRFTKQ